MAVVDIDVLGPGSFSLSVVLFVFAAVISGRINLSKSQQSVRRTLVRQTDLLSFDLISLECSVRADCITFFITLSFYLYHLDIAPNNPTSGYLVRFLRCSVTSFSFKWITLRPKRAVSLEKKPTREAGLVSSADKGGV